MPASMETARDTPFQETHALPLLNAKEELHALEEFAKLWPLEILALPTMTFDLHGTLIATTSPSPHLEPPELLAIF